MSERELQSSVIEFLSHALPVAAAFHHSPNEGKRGWHAQRDFKHGGSVPGWPDIEIIYKGRGYFIELKAPKKYPTPEQRGVHAWLRRAGAPVVTCRSLIEVEMALTGFGIPLNAKVAA